jgi:transcriptional repressor NrdR
MTCPSCHKGETVVVDSRETEEGEIRRRRECERCGYRFTTYEAPYLDFPIVVKKDGSRQKFERKKIVEGILKACEKRPVTAVQIDELVDRVERRLLESGLREVTSREIGEMVMEGLKKLDKVAYIRFASVYRSFQDPTEFAKLVRRVKEVKKVRSDSGK